MTLKIGGIIDIIHAFDTESTSLAAIISLDVWEMRNSHYISVKSKVWQISAAEPFRNASSQTVCRRAFCKPPLPHHQKKIQSITGFILSTSDSCEGYSQVCYVNKISGSHIVSAETREEIKRFSADLHSCCVYVNVESGISSENYAPPFSSLIYIFFLLHLQRLV